MAQWIQLLGKALFVESPIKKWVVVDGETVFASFFKGKVKTIGGKKVVGWYTRGGKHIPIFAGGKKSGGGWAAFGSQTDAEEFSKNSKIKETLYHGTNETALNGIKQNGFKAYVADEPSLGKTIHFSNSTTVAGQYSEGIKGGTIVKAKVNVKKPFTISESNFDKAIYGKTKTQFTDYLANARKKHDAIVIDTGGRGNYYILFNPKNIMAYE